jgi:hypothetical protein
VYVAYTTKGNIFIGNSAVFNYCLSLVDFPRCNV